MNLHSDNRGVAYLIFYIFLSLFIFGMTYAIISDVRDASTKNIYGRLSPLGNEYNDAESDWGFDVLNLLLSFSVVFFVIGLIWHAKQMAQKPERPW